MKEVSNYMCNVTIQIHYNCKLVMCLNQNLFIEQYNTMCANVHNIMNGWATDTAIVNAKTEYCSHMCCKSKIKTKCKQTKSERAAVPVVFQWRVIKKFVEANLFCQSTSNTSILK